MILGHGGRNRRPTQHGGLKSPRARSSAASAPYGSTAARIR